MQNKNVIFALFVIFLSGITYLTSSADGSSRDLSPVLGQAISHEQKELRCYGVKDIQYYFNHRAVTLISEKKPVPMEKIYDLNGNQIPFKIAENNDYRIEIEIENGDKILKKLSLIYPIDSIDSPTICIYRDEKQISYYFYVQLQKNSDSLTASLVKFSPRQNLETEERELGQIRSHLELLKKGFIFPGRIDEEIPLQKSKFPERHEFPQDIIDLLDFCSRNGSRLRDYIEDRIDIILPIIKQYIKEGIPALTSSINASQALQILQNDPDLLLNNLHKFFAAGDYPLEYKILSDTTTTLKDKIESLENLKERQDIYDCITV